MESLADNAIMLKVSEGQTDLLGLLYERYKKVLFGFFYHMTHDAAQSEDMVQNTFIRLLRYRDGYKGEGEFKAWLFRIARNVNYDAYRKNGSNQNDSLEKWSEYISDPVMNHEEDTSHKDELYMLNVAMGRLEPDKKEVLVLSKIDGMKYKEIGDILDCSEGTVKSKVFRALQALKKEFEWVQSRI